MPRNIIPLRITWPRHRDPRGYRTEMFPEERFRRADACNAKLTENSRKDLLEHPEQNEMEWCCD
jgi:hypothetical protein